MVTQTTPTSLPIPLTAKVSGSGISETKQRIAAYGFPPRRPAPSLPHLWAFLMHGATYDWHYWHLPVPGELPDTYSFAAYLAAHGIGVVAIDHPGCGQSRWDCDGSALTLERVARAGNGYISGTATHRSVMRPLFYLEDVPSSVIEADERWSTTIPSGLISALMIPGATAEDARRIRVPVLMLFGATDVVADPMLEPAYYPRAARRTLLIQPGSAHCHNVSSQHMTVKLLVLRWLWQVVDSPEMVEQGEGIAATV